MAGTILTFTLTNGGGGYPDSGTFPIIQGANETATYTITARDPYPGPITAIVLVDGGTGYTVGEAQLGADPDSGSGGTINIDSVSSDTASGYTNSLS